jgi:hypothetical protein
MGFLRSSLLYVEDSISLNTSKVASWQCGEQTRSRDCLITASIRWWFRWTLWEVHWNNPEVSVSKWRIEFTSSIKGYSLDARRHLLALSSLRILRLPSRISVSSLLGWSYRSEDGAPSYALFSLGHVSSASLEELHAKENSKLLEQRVQFVDSDCYTKSQAKASRPSRFGQVAPFDNVGVQK